MNFFLETYTVAGYVSQQTANTSNWDLIGYFAKSRGLLTRESLASAKTEQELHPWNLAFDVQ